MNLIALVSAFLGWRGVAVTIPVGCLAGSAAGLTLIGLRRLQRRETIPFGPFLAFGAIVAVFWGEQAVTSYLSFLR